MKAEKKVTLFTLGFMFIVIIAITVWSAIAYVALHFIGKFW